MKIWNFLAQYSVLLVTGALAALVWANIDGASYHKFVEYPLVDHFIIGHLHDGHRTLTIHYLVNDVLMAFFFVIAGKEVWEAVALKDGSLKGRKAMTPLIATAGGMVGPVAVYLGIAAFLGSETYSAVANGWAIPTATDIAFSYLVGRMIFGAGHPAVGFLLLLAIADDACGLIILAVFYPTNELAPAWLLLPLAATLLAYFGFNWLPKRLDESRGDPNQPRATKIARYLKFWPYMIAGAFSWYGFQESGLHPALGLLPIIVAIPHADRDFGVFAEEDLHLKDQLNLMEKSLKYPVEVILLLFGLVNAGVEFSAIGSATWLVLAGLVIGKPVGIYLFGAFAANVLKLGMPVGVRTIDLVVIGFIAAIGFTVSLFIASVAFPPGPVQDAAKMGALFSFGAAALSFAAAKICGVKKGG